MQLEGNGRAYSDGSLTVREETPVRDKREGEVVPCDGGDTPVAVETQQTAELVDTEVADTPAPSPKPTQDPEAGDVRQPEAPTPATHTPHKVAVIKPQKKKKDIYTDGTYWKLLGAPDHFARYLSKAEPLLLPEEWKECGKP